MMVVIPSTIQVFAWSSTVMIGTPLFKTPLLFIGGFIVILRARRPDGDHVRSRSRSTRQMTDTYFVVAHFHYIIFGAAVFPLFGGMYYWFPKVTGRMYHERLGQISFWVTFVGTNLLVLPDAHRRAARHAAPRLHLPERPRLGDLQPARDDRRLRARSSGSCVLSGTSSSSYRPRRAGRPGPVHGGTLEWTIPLAAAATTTSRSSRRSRARIRTGTRDRARTRATSSAAMLVLDAGTADRRLDGRRRALDEIVAMPHESPWPIVLAARA